MSNESQWTVTATGSGCGFASFYSQHRVEAVQLAWLLSRDATAAEDIAHDAFAAIVDRYPQLDRPGAYLRTSIVNGVRERARRQGRDRRRTELVAVTQPHATPGPTGGLADIVAGLPLKARTAVVLRYWGGLSDLEIADTMGIRPGTARSILSRALSSLRKEIQ